MIQALILCGGIIDFRYF